jgi:hypothetical protein
LTDDGETYGLAAGTKLYHESTQTISDIDYHANGLIKKNKITNTEKIYTTADGKTLARTDYKWIGFQIQNAGSASEDFLFPERTYLPNQYVLNNTTVVIQTDMANNDAYGRLTGYKEYTWTGAMADNLLQRSIFTGIEYDNRNNKTGYKEEKTICKGRPDDDLGAITEYKVKGIPRPTITTVRLSDSVAYDDFARVKTYTDETVSSGASDMKSVITRQETLYDASSYQTYYKELTEQLNTADPSVYHTYQITERTIAGFDEWGNIVAGLSGYDSTNRLRSYQDKMYADPAHPQMNARPNVTDTVTVFSTEYDTFGRVRKETRFEQTEGKISGRVVLSTSQRVTRFNLAYNDIGLIEDYVEVATADTTRPEIDKVWTRRSAINYDTHKSNPNGQINSYVEQVAEYSHKRPRKMYNGGDWDFDGKKDSDDGRLEDYTQELRNITTVVRLGSEYSANTGLLTKYEESINKNNYALTTTVVRSDISYDTVGRVYGFKEEKKDYISSLADGGLEPVLQTGHYMD